MVLMISKNKQRLLNTQEKRVSAIITLVSSLIIVTPLCGFLFQCGCDWPWAGLDSLCNFYKLDEEHKCPWCASMITGLLSTGTAIVTGVWASILSLRFLTRQNPVKEVLIRIVFGLMVFVGVAFLMAMVAAKWQGYPI
jgi:hypothetical protein